MGVKTVFTIKTPIKIVLISIISDKYPVLAENYGLSVLAGYLYKKFGELISITIHEQQFSNLNKMIEDINSKNYDIIGFSVPIGTLESLKYILNNMSEELTNLVIFGGTVPTCMPIDFLKTFYPKGIACIGDGELSMEEMVRFARGEVKPLSSVPNIAYLKNNKEIFTQKIILEDLTLASYPIRENINNISLNGGQTYIELSRGCSWNKCTFCAIRNKSNNKRVIQVKHVINNLNLLLNECTKNQEIVFTDEEFIGIDNESLYMAKEFAATVRKKKMKANLYIATSVKSVVNSEDSEYKAVERKQVFRELKKAGVNRIFLGIESGATNQLLRYAKGIKPDESIAAIKLLLSMGIQLDIGLIMFDPLMDVDEIQQNIEFVERAGIIGLISVLAHEIRVQEGTAIVKMIRAYEKEMNVRILGSFDLNTLSYPILKYKDKRVELIAHISLSKQKEYYEFWYALKGRIRSESSLYSVNSYKIMIKYYKHFQELELSFLKEITKEVILNGYVEDNVIILLNEELLIFFEEFMKVLIDNPYIDPNQKIMNGVQLYLRRVSNNVHEIFTKKSITI